jgi:hypothetical protein
MHPPQFKLRTLLFALTVCALLAAWIATGSKQPPLHPDGISTMLLTRGYPTVYQDASGLEEILRSKHQAKISIAISIAIAMLCTAFAWTLLLLNGNTRNTQILARAIWTIGLAAYIVHVAFAFSYYYRWNHSLAAWHTAYRTWELTGWYWTGGIWINYFFTLVWAADVVYWWLGLELYDRRPHALKVFVPTFFAFMIFQAGVVFGHGAIRWATLPGLIVVGLFALSRWFHPVCPTLHQKSFT